MHFNNPDDKFAVQIQDDLKKDGLDAVIEKYMGIAASSELAKMIKKEYAAGSEK